GAAPALCAAAPPGCAQGGGAAPPGPPVLSVEEGALLAAEEELEELLASCPVLLFMKGSPDRPRCGFSRAAVLALRGLGVAFDHVDVLERPALRQALRRRWPTFPQLYSQGLLLGGADAVSGLAARGELLDALRSSTARERAALRLLLPPGGAEGGGCGAAHVGAAEPAEQKGPPAVVATFDRQESKKKKRHTDRLAPRPIGGLPRGSVRAVSGSGATQ
ncbi:unnamed protein product, partial [Prorocentrum cordatum]